MLGFFNYKNLMFTVLDNPQSRSALLGCIVICEFLTSCPGEMFQRLVNCTLYFFHAILCNIYELKGSVEVMRESVRSVR